MRLTKNTVKQAMANSAITQVELSNMLGVSKRQVNRWFASEGRIPTKYHSKIKNILNFSENEILSKVPTIILLSYFSARLMMKPNVSQQLSQ